MCLLPNKYCLILLLLGLSNAVYAEKADREKPLHIEANQMSLDNAKRISIFEGKVDLTQGTLHVVAEKIVVTEDAAGHKFCVATGHLASFRQKRDEVDEYVEGYGERVEYDTLKEQIDLFVHARVKREQDDVRGDHITYNTLTEVFRVDSPENNGRVRATLQPQVKEHKNAAPKPDETKAPVPAKPAALVTAPKASEPVAADPKDSTSKSVPNTMEPITHEAK